MSTTGTKAGYVRTSVSVVPEITIIFLSEGLISLSCPRSTAVVGPASGKHSLTAYEYPSIVPTAYQRGGYCGWQTILVHTW